MTDGRTARGERTRAAVLDATLGLIVKHGADAVTQRKVAVLAGVSLASTTYHFPAAADLLVAAFTEAARRSGEEFDQLADQVEAGTLTPVEAAMAFAGRVPHGAGWAPDAIPQLFLAAAHRPPLRPIAAAYLDKMAARFTPLAGSPETALTLARALTGLILHELERGEPRPSDTLRGDLNRLFDAFTPRDPQT